MANEKKDDGSAESIAYKLMYDVSSIEGGLKSRKQLLDTYAECLHAAKGYREFPKGP